MKLATLVSVTTFTPVLALSGMATTTRYYDGQMGACGCGTSSSSPFAWQLGIAPGVYTAAASQAIFGAGSTWCGSGCGKCFRLTSTGAAPCGSCGTGGASGQSIIVMVTNLCPYNGNQQWCPNPGAKNAYGYSYHFDIQAKSAVFGDNPVVSFTEVACPSQAVSDFAQCQCK